MDSLLQTLRDLPIPGYVSVVLLIGPLFLFYSMSSLRRKLPPGPKGLPIIGNMLMMDQLTHRGLAALADKYGGLIRLKMGFLNMIAVSSPEFAKQVLQVQDNNFSNRPATIAISYLTYDRLDMAFAHYGPFWRQMRKMCVIKLFSRRRAESWASVRDEVDNMVKSIAERTNTPVNVGEMIFSLTNNITFRAAFGAISHKKEKFMQILQEFSKLFGAFNVADFWPFLGWIDPQGFRVRLKKARDDLDEFIDVIIDDHMKKDKSTDDGESDMVDELLAFHSEEAKSNESDDLNSIRISRDHIKALIMDVMFGGVETVASAIEWALSELMASPDDMKRIQRELEDVVGLDRRLEETDLDKLPFFRCVIKETLRLHPPIPLLLHETAEDANVSGYFIPKQSRVMINAWAIGRDPNSWKDPNKFNPSRFEESGMPDFKGSNFEFIPFGSGRRSCPGMQLGLYAFELGVGHLVHSFNWELPNGMKPSELDMSDVFGLTVPRANRLIAVATPRLTCPLA